MSIIVITRPCHRCGATKKAFFNLDVATALDGWCRYYFCSSKCVKAWLEARFTDQ